MKLGKKPARPDAVKFKLTDYVNLAKLPKPPKRFGHEDLMTPDWGMLANDQFGDCVWAGAAHETIMWGREAGHQHTFTDQTVLSDYAAVTGFNPNDPNTDQGTDMKDAASYRRKVGIVDTSGTRHKIEAYLALDPGNVNQLYAAMYLFGAVGIGIEFPSSALDQFNQGKTWSIARNSPIEGGHYIPLVAKRSHLECVTWGQLQGMTLGFFKKYCDEALAYVSLTPLTNNKSPEGFDAQVLLDDLKALKTVK